MYKIQNFSDMGLSLGALGETNQGFKFELVDAIRDHSEGIEPLAVKIEFSKRYSNIDSKSDSVDINLSLNSTLCGFICVKSKKDLHALSTVCSLSSSLYEADSLLGFQISTILENQQVIKKLLNKMSCKIFTGLVQALFPTNWLIMLP